MLNTSKLRACGYVRVSTYSPKQQSSLENQKKQICNAISKKKFTFINIYDDIKSGTLNNRTGLNTLLNDLKNNEFDVIIVKDISRLTRNTSTASNIKDLLIKHKKHLISLDDSINTIDDYNSISKLIVNAQFYEDESRALSNRMKNTKLDNCHEGKFNGSIPPYGYYLKDSKLIKRDDESPFVVQKIFYEFIIGKSFTEIANELNNTEAETPSQKANKSNASSQWRDTTIRGILNNISYCGHLLQHKTIPIDLCDKRRLSVPETEKILVKNTHEAIITDEIFEEAKQKLATKIINKTRKSTYLYSNILYCRDCGSKMHKRTTPKGENYYICGTANKKGVKYCSRNTIKEIDLTNMLIEEINNYISVSNINCIKKNTDKYVEDLLNSLKKSYDDCSVRIESLQNQKAKILAQLPENIPRKEYDYFISIKDNKISEILKEQSKLSILSNKISTEDLSKIIDDVKRNSISLETFNSEILNTLISRIEFSHKQNPKVYYNCNTSNKNI